MTRRHLRRCHIEKQLATLLDLMHTQNRVLRDLSGMVAKGRDPRERGVAHDERVTRWQWDKDKGWHNAPDDDDWPPNDANEMVYKRRAGS